MKREAGFTLIEMAVVVAILAILAAIAIPNGIAWISKGRVNSAARDIMGMIQKARIEAVRQNMWVVAAFTGNSYMAFVDNDGDWILDPGETTVYSATLPSGVSFVTPILGGGGGQTRFNTRAIPSFAGPITLTNNSGFTVTVTLGKGGVPRVS